MSYLSLSHFFNCFLDHPCHHPFPNYLPIRHPLTELPRSFHPIRPPLPVLYRLSTWPSVQSSRPPLPVPALAFFPPSTFSPGPCLILQPCSAISFLPPLPPSGLPPFTFVDVASVPFNPCGLALLGSFLPPLFLEPLLLPAGLDLRPGPCRYQGGSCLQFLSSFPTPLCFLFT